MTKSPHFQVLPGPNCGGVSGKAVFGRFRFPCLSSEIQGNRIQIVQKTMCG